MAVGPAYIVDDWMREMDTLEKDFHRDPRRNRAISWLWRDPARAYRYLVLRTLGAASFGVDRERAARFAFEK